MPIALHRHTPAEQMRWHVTGEAPSTPKAARTNCMNKAVRWLRDADVHWVKKVAVVALSALSLIAASYFTSWVLFPLVAIPLCGRAMLELSYLKGEEQREEARLFNIARNTEEQRAAFANVRRIFGGEERWAQIPELRLNRNIVADTGYINNLRPDELPHPIMKGTDEWGRPFVALKLRAVHPDPDRDAVLTLFQRYTEGGLWVYSSSANLPLNVGLTDTDWDLIQQLANLRYVLDNQA